MEMIKNVFGFMVKLLMIVVEILVTLMLLAAKLILMLTFTMFKITLGLIRVAEYN